ncbi:MAG: efflux RND transporter permease subunit, partial [Phycisphaerales bacterium]
VQIVADRAACSRFGIAVSQIQEMVELAIGGEVIDTLYLNTRRFAIHMRFREDRRVDPESIRRLLVHTDDGSLIPLSQVADVV